jgi:hypothetical protein
MAQNNNIIIGNPGVSGESNNIRIGVEGTQTATYVAGIYGNSIGATNAPVFVDNTGKLGILSVPSDIVFGTQSFFYYLNSDLSNLTGNGTSYYLGSTHQLTQLFSNAGANFNIGTGSGTGQANAAYFEAPAAGVYFFQIIMQLLTVLPLDSDSDATNYIITSGGKTYESTFSTTSINPTPIFVADQLLLVSTSIHLNINEKAYFAFDVTRNDSAINQGLHGGTPYVTYVCGYRVF